MPRYRVVVFDPETGSEITVAGTRSLGAAVTAARSASALGAWIVIGTEPAVWLSARALEAIEVDNGIAEERAAVVRYYRLARHLLAIQGIDTERIDRELPLSADGGVPEDA
ncbi:MAG: hypothetical protein AB7I32_18215 [Gammaproteobacteria bacterium]